MKSYGYKIVQRGNTFIVYAKWRILFMNFWVPFRQRGGVATWIKEFKSKQEALSAIELDKISDHIVHEE